MKQKYTYNFVKKEDFLNNLTIKECENFVDNFCLENHIKYVPTDSFYAHILEQELIDIKLLTNRFIHPRPLYGLKFYITKNCKRIKNYDRNGNWPYIYFNSIDNKKNYKLFILDSCGIKKLTPHNIEVEGSVFVKDQNVYIVDRETMKHIYNMGKVYEKIEKLRAEKTALLFNADLKSAAYFKKGNIYTKYFISLNLQENNGLAKLNLETNQLEVINSFPISIIIEKNNLKNNNQSPSEISFVGKNELENITKRNILKLKKEEWNKSLKPYQNCYSLFNYNILIKKIDLSKSLKENFSGHYIKNIKAVESFSINKKHRILSDNLI